MDWTKQKSDETVEVGANLYKIDTDAEASVVSAGTTASSSSSSKSTTKESAAATAEKVSEAPKTTANTKAESSAAKSSSSGGGGHHRTPSIHFLGKEGWARRRSGVQTPTIVYVPPSYGRPVFTEEEMEALVTGGASLAPDVKKYSSGSMFGY